MLVSEYQRDDELYNEPLLVTNVSWCTSAKGLAYISAILQDKSGTIDTKKWVVDSEDKEIWQVGNVLYITGTIIENNNKLQLKVLNCSKYTGAIEAERFAGTAPEKKEDLVKELKEYINSIGEEDYKEVVRKILNKYNEDYLVFPAAVRNHHNFISGILYHTICILRMAKAVSTLYKDVNTDLLY